MDLPGEHGVGATVNVADLSPYDAGEEDCNLGTGSLREGGNDEDIGRGMTEEGRVKDLEGQ